MSTQNKILQDIISSRKSSYPAQYSQQPIPQEILQLVLDAAGHAPSHRRTFPWRLTPFRGEQKDALGQELANIYKKIVAEQDFSQNKYIAIAQSIKKSDVIIPIVAEFSGLVPEWEEVAATAMAVQNMYLTCQANQVGCYWSSPKPTTFLGDFLELKENQKCLGLFYMGMLDEGF